VARTASLPDEAVSTWDGDALLEALEHAVAELAAHVEEVNALNVFPVPDGDTGSNMLATLLAALAESRTVPPASRSVGTVAAAFSLGALMGARGNSGVILSQFFRGLADALDGTVTLDGRALARSLVRACDASYAAVGHPVEGTILTVARELSTAARETLEVDPRLASVLEAAVAAAVASVERTPSLLPILRQAGVVDAGGRGLELLLRGALRYNRGEPPARPLAAVDGQFPTFELPDEDGAFGYETVYVLQPRPDDSLVPASIRDQLEQIGESVVVAGDERAVKIHVHSERPDEVIAFGLSIGTLSNISIENLDGQARELRRLADVATVPVAPDGHAPAPRAAAGSSFGEKGRTRTGQAVVAVAPGAGLARVFEGIGVGAVVMGGQRSNPSAGEIAEAIHAAGSDEVLVLPNNPNVQLAAAQAAALCPDVRVEIVATRNAAEGVAALLAFDPKWELDANSRAMRDAAGALQTLQVTAAVRDARLGDRAIREGDHIVLAPDDTLLAADDDRLAAVRDAVARLSPGFELLTLYYGDRVSAAEADDMAGSLREELDGVEVEVIDGGQAHYSFLISAE
jgi:DAK2 domain fusion protein YloV